MFPPPDVVCRSKRLPNDSRGKEGEPNYAMLGEPTTRGNHDDFADHERRMGVVDAHEFVTQTASTFGEWDPIVAVLDRGLHALAGLGGELVDEANRIGAILWSPPRVVVTGRLKAGKSTLVNALLGVPIAVTAALEATSVVTVYQDGAPARAVVVGLDGSRTPLRDPNAPIPMPDELIAWVDRWLPSAAIRELTLIDTPGLSTLTVANDEATRRVLIDGFAQTRSMSVDADAAVFLFDAAPRADEIEFLRSLGFTPLNTLGVLSRADSFGEGAFGRRDPIGHALEHARVLAARLADTVATVVPVAGLLAETSHTGRLTEADARALHLLAGLDSFALFGVLDADDPAPLSPAQRDRLLDLVGEYGAVYGSEIAEQGGAALDRWLSERSGIEALRRVLYTTIREIAVVHRADRILRALDELAYRHPARDRIRGILHGIRSDPAVAPVLLAGALRGMLVADPESPVTAELRGVLAGRTVAERVGLDPSAPPPAITAAIDDRLVAMQRRQLSTATAAEDSALSTLRHAYTVLRNTPVPTGRYPDGAPR